MIKKLAGNILIGVTANQQQRIERIDAEDFAHVMEKVADDLALLGQHVTRDYLERGIYALKQYYAVAMLDPANAHAISSPIDPFWHAHILFTADYRKFCDKVIGEYMNHVPLDRKNANKVSNVRQLYLYTLEVLPRIFADVDSEFWPTHVTDDKLICFHDGNQGLYEDVQSDRLFEPVAAGSAWAYA